MPSHNFFSLWTLSWKQVNQNYLLLSSVRTVVTQNEPRPLTINRSIIDLMISYLNTDEKPDGFIMFKEQSIYTYKGLTIYTYLNLWAIYAKWIMGKIPNDVIWLYICSFPADSLWQITWIQILKQLSDMDAIIFSNKRVLWNPWIRRCYKGWTTFV